MQDGAELQARAAAAPPPSPSGARGELGHGPARRQLEAPHHFRLFFFFFPCLFVCGVVFVGIFSPRLYSQTWLFQLRRKPTNESVSEGTPGRHGKTRMDVCVTPASLFFPGMCKGRLPQPLPGGGDAAVVRNRLDGVSTASSLHPSTFTIAALPAPLCALGDAPRPPSSGGESPASLQPPPGPLHSPSFPRSASHRKMRAGQTPAPPAAHPGRGPSAPPRRSPPPGGGERKALIDPGRGPPGDECTGPGKQARHLAPPARPRRSPPRGAPARPVRERRRRGEQGAGCPRQAGGPGAALPPPPLVLSSPRRDPPAGPGSFPEETRTRPLLSTKAKRPDK